MTVDRAVRELRRGGIVIVTDSADRENEGDLTWPPRTPRPSASRSCCGSIGAQILAQLGIRQLRLMTNNPAKYEGLEGYGLEIVERVPLPPRVTRHNVAYLEAKRLRLGHRLELGDAQAR